ncbi:uncharacterized protein LOC109819785 isoform X2 [Asparagus officinalis]|nr:uncharacterized protein LOC109819785 isoform X2 [Asparagus officinalis]
MDDVDGDEIKFSDWEVLEIIKKVIPFTDLQTMYMQHIESKRQVSFKVVVERLLGCYLSKVEQTGSWGERPLTSSQKIYAATDVGAMLDLLPKSETDIWQDGWRVYAHTFPLTPAKKRELLRACKLSGNITVCPLTAPCPSANIGVPKFIVDNKKLVQFLRKHGFDTTISRSTLSDALENDKKEGRVVLTRSFTVSTRSSNEALQLKAYTKDHQDELNKIVEVYGLQQQKLLPLFCAECNRPMNFFLMLLAEAQERKKLPIRQEKIRSFEIRENLIKSLESKESESVTFKECLDCKYFVPC